MDAWDGLTLQAVLEFMNNMLQQQEVNERGRAKKSSLASLMTVFKKNKSAKFTVKEIKDVDIRA